MQSLTTLDAMPTITAAAKQLGITRQAMDRWITKLEISKTKQDGMAFISEEDMKKVDAFRKGISPLANKIQPMQTQPQQNLQQELQPLQPSEMAIENKFLKEQVALFKDQLKIEQDRTKQLMEQNSNFQKMLFMNQQRMIDLEKENRNLLEHKPEKPEEEEEQGIFGTIQKVRKKKKKKR